MNVGTPQKYKHFAFVDTYLLPHWLLSFPCAACARQDAPERLGVSRPNGYGNYEILEIWLIQKNVQGRHYLWK